jgi:transposase-like protein
VEHLEFEAIFFGKRWPNGFECPRCAHGSCYTIRTRRLPLYQCRLCKHQTTVTAGTVMDRSRTPLAKWAAAIDLLTERNGINAVKLAAEIKVSHKTAWLMLRSFRRAISEVEAGRNMGSNVYAGLQALGPYSIFFPYRHYQNERVVLISASMDGRTGQPTAIALTPVSTEHLRPGMKMLSHEGAATILQEHNAMLLKNFTMSSSPLRTRFTEAKQWLNRLFHGIGSASLASYLDEYCFRWNTAAQGLSLRDHWYRVCLRAF